MSQGRMSTEFEPNIDTEIGNCVDGWRELNRLPDAARPMGGVPGVSVEPVPGDRTKERDGFGLWRKIGQRILERVRPRLHHRVMKWMVDSDEPRKNALGFKLGEHRLDRMPWAGEGEGAW